MPDQPIQSGDPSANSASSRARIFDRRSLPAGVVPRHLQQWVLIGTAVVMVGILALSGPTTPSKPATATPAAASAIDPNQKRIEGYQRRIQEQADRLAAEQEQLQRAKDALTAPPGSDQRVPSTRTSPPTSLRFDDEPPIPSTGGSSGGDSRDVHDDRGPVADNVAFSRPASVQAPGVAGRDPSAALPPAVPISGVSTYQPTDVAAAFAVAPTSPTSLPSPTSLANSTSPTRPTSPVLPGALPQPAATTTSIAAPAQSTPPAAPASPRPVTPAPPGEARYRVYEGTVIETVLTNRLDGTFNGPVNCLVSVPVYASDHIVIPAGARVLGDAHAVNTFGQSRLAVTFHRVILPNGTHIDLDGFHGLNQIGDLGLRDQVDRHYAQIFGVSLALGAISGFAQGHTAIGVDATGLDAYRQGAASSVSQSSTRVLDRFLNILPTVTIREGHRIKVYLSNDLELPAYRPALASTGGRP